MTYVPELERDEQAEWQKRGRSGMGPDIKWYVPAVLPSRLCAVHIHRPSVLRADGWVGYFSRVRRLRCACGTWEWTEYNGSNMRRERVDPDHDAKMVEMRATMDRIDEALGRRVALK